MCLVFIFSCGVCDVALHMKLSPKSFLDFMFTHVSVGYSFTNVPVPMHQLVDMVELSLNAK